MAGAVPALEFAYAITARGGTTVTAGLPHPDKRFSLAPVSMVAEERTLKGSYIGSAAPLRDVPRLIALFKARQAAGGRAIDAPAQARRHQRRV
jgi:alcohol dehydrogenase